MPDLPGPLAVKVLSPDILHKSDAGLVALNVAPADLERVAEGLLSRAQEALPGARLEGVLVQPIVQGLAEMVLGWRDDAEAGPVVMLGMGGVTAELRPQIAVRVAPVDMEAAREMIAELPDLRALDGYRNLPRGDLEALALAVVRFSRLGLAVPGLAEAEINPLMVRGQGEGVVALDALMVMAGDGMK